MSDDEFNQWLVGFIDKVGLVNKSCKRFYSSPAAYKIPSGDIPSSLQSIIYGLMLGDLNCQKVKLNSRLRFEQSGANKEYVLHLYDFFKDYCNSSFSIRSRYDKRTEKTYESVYFQTATSPIFNQFAAYGMIYFMRSPKMVKK